MQSLTCVGSVLEQREVRRAFDKEPHAPIAGMSTAATSNEKLQADLLFLDDVIASHAMDVFSEYPLLIPVRTKNPEEVWNGFRHS